MKKSVSPYRRLFLSKNFIMMLVMLVVIIMAISAWFTVHKTVTASNMTVKAISNEIDLAKVKKTYDENWDVIKEGPDEFTGRLTFTDFSLTKDCTGDGVNLIVPEFNITNDYESVRTHSGKDVNVNLAGKDAISNEYARIYKLKNPNLDEPEYQYAEFEFYARSKNKNIMLNSDSVVISVTEKNGGSLASTPSLEKKSAYGNFNVDSLVGAIRVAIIGQPCTSVDQDWQPSSGNAGTIGQPTTTRGSEVKQLLWVPRPDIQLHIPENPAGDITNWSVLTGCTPGNSSSTYKHTYYKNNNNNSGLEYVDPDNDSKTIVSDGTSNGVKSIGRTQNISDFGNASHPLVDLAVDKSNYTVTAQYYVTKYIVKVWIEGTDSEARRAMDGGAFNVCLSFT